MDRTERLLDLVALLLDRKEPTSWAELRQAFPDDYGSGSEEAAERKFERDKAELLELGIPIVYTPGDDERKDGYLVEKEAYYLPDAGLTPEEVAVLYAAGSAALASGAFPGRDDLAHALRKIGFFAGRDLPTPKLRLELTSQSTPELPTYLEQLWAAAAARKFATLSYYSPHKRETTQRKVDPYGLALRQGTWCLVGHCHLRQGIRTFLVHRVRALQVNTGKPRSADFEVPKDFRLEDYVATYPWQHRFHPPVEVEVTLRGELAPMAERLLPIATVTRDGALVRCRLSATDLEGLTRYVLSLGPGAKLTAPAEAVQKFTALASKILSAHRDEAA